MYKIFFALFSIALCSSFSYSHSEPDSNKHVPIIVVPTDTAGAPVPFHGLIREDGTDVELDVPLYASDDDEGEAGLICGYVIHNEKNKRIPFSIEVIDASKGTARVKVKEGEELNYEKRSRYKFAISAYSCGTPAHMSERAWMLIEVGDKNEFPPNFDKAIYYVELEEGQIFDSILRLVAVDKDRSPEFHNICSYHILTPDEPFIINNDGVLSNTEELDYNTKRNHILAVVAEDCGHLRSETPAMVNIKVLPKCQIGWQDIPVRIEYLPGSGKQKLAPDAQLKVCDATCTVDKVAARVVLETKHIGKGCDRDTYTIRSQRHLCDANADSIDLLPEPEKDGSWTKELPTDDGHESDQIFSFDGNINAVEVPPGHFAHNLDKQFTIATWMKHDRPESDEDESEDSDESEYHHHANKEHILCMSDSQGMNRHHYSLFIHGEKIVFLLRQEAEDASDMEEFKPAEWRWHIPQINDDQWHHYALNVDFPQVNFYIDGKLLIEDKQNREVVDDWPMHRTHKVNSTKLLIGACWQGLDQKLSMFFKGYLAGLYMLNGQTEKDRVIKCLTNCQENLEFNSLSAMDSGMSVSFNNDMTEISITGKNVTEVENVLHEISYVNARSFPTPGRRSLTIQTAVSCSESLEGSRLGNPEIPTFNTHILVLKSDKPTITISGTRNLARSVDDLAIGQTIFSSINIVVTMAGSDPEDETDEEKMQELKIETENSAHLPGYKSDKPFLLDTCTIIADPALNLRTERLTFPRVLMAKLSMTEHEMDSSETNEGVVITGLNTVENYSSVIRGIYYYHEDADHLSTRRFILSCSSQTNRFISNQMPVTVSAIHQERHVEVARAQMQEPESVHTGNVLKSISAEDAAAAPSMGMIAIIVVCVGFLLFMITVGVIRIRAAHQARTRVLHVEEKTELEWDNTPLNITVNPLEREIGTQFDCPEEPELRNLRDDSDSEDDADSYREDLETSEEESEKLKDRELEWDDSTLSF